MTRIVLGLGPADLLNALFDSVVQSSTEINVGRFHQLVEGDFCRAPETRRMSRRLDRGATPFEENLDNLLWIMKMKGFSKGTTFLNLDHLLADTIASTTVGDAVGHIRDWSRAHQIEAKFIIAEPDEYWRGVAQFLDTLRMSLLPFPAVDQSFDTVKHVYGSEQLRSGYDDCISMKVNANGSDALAKVQGFLGMRMGEDYTFCLSNESSLGRAQFAISQSDILRKAFGPDGLLALSGA